METIKNSQEQNESRDALHPEWPAQYVVTNRETGTVIWCKTYAQATNMAVEAHGSITNTETCPRAVVEATLREARERMDCGAGADRGK